MKLKNYLLIDGRAVRVGADMTRKFPALAGKHVPWFSIVHHDKVASVADIAKVYLTYAYYNENGELDVWQHELEAAQKISELFNPLKNRTSQEKAVPAIRHKVKIPKLNNEEYKSLQAKVSKDIGIMVNINLLLQAVL
ncbi:MAG: hypothetical protein H6Q66_1976 [Firmicutes bacterium]|nr:hypothetical protein [Bacillota bacterium]